MERKQLIVFPRGSLDHKTKELLSRHGYIGIEADDPKAILTVLPSPPLTANLSGDEIVQALVDTCFSNDSRHKDFGAAVLRAIKTKKGTP